MNSLEPFIRHELENQPGTAAAPQANSTRNAPPLGSMPLQPPAASDTPGTQPVSYTHLTLPTKRIVEISVVAVLVKKKKHKT